MMTKYTMLHNNNLLNILLLYLGIEIFHTHSLNTSLFAQALQLNTHISHDRHTHNHYV